MPAACAAGPCSARLSPAACGAFPNEGIPRALPHGRALRAPPGFVWGARRSGGTVSRAGVARGQQKPVTDPMLRPFLLFPRHTSPPGELPGTPLTSHSLLIFQTISQIARIEKIAPTCALGPVLARLPLLVPDVLCSEEHLVQDRQLRGSLSRLLRRSGPLHSQDTDPFEEHRTRALPDVSS